MRAYADMMFTVGRLSILKLLYNRLAACGLDAKYAPTTKNESDARHRRTPNANTKRERLESQLGELNRKNDRLLDAKAFGPRVHSGPGSRWAPSKPVVWSRTKKEENEGS